MRKSELCHVFQGFLTRLNLQSLTGEFSFYIRRVEDSVNCDLSEAWQGPFLGMKLEKEKINVVLLTAEMCSDVDICFSVSRQPWLSKSARNSTSLRSFPQFSSPQFMIYAALVKFS